MAESNIEWTDATWHVKSAAARLGISVEEYLERRRAGLKHCRSCRRWRPVGVFGVDLLRGDGRSAVCGLCRRTPRQLALIPRSPAERDRHRYATDELYRLERRQHAHARKRGVAPLPAEGIEALQEAFDGRCAYCGHPAQGWDHIIPVATGGATVPGNIVPACTSCNSRKKAMDVFDFLGKYALPVSHELESALALAAGWGDL